MKNSQSSYVAVVSPSKYRPASKTRRCTRHPMPDWFSKSSRKRENGRGMFHAPSRSPKYSRFEYAQPTELGERASAFQSASRECDDNRSSASRKQIAWTVGQASRAK